MFELNVNWMFLNLEMVLCLCVDPAGAARSDPAAERTDSPAPGSAWSAPADHHPAASDSHHRWTEPGVKLRPVELQIPLIKLLLHD